MQEVCGNFGAEPREFNGEPNRVHYPPTVALSRLVNPLKGVSSRRIRQEHVRRVTRARTNGPG